MVTYLVTTPYWLRLLYPKGLVWEMPVTKEPTIYLTFDDGPHPTATPFVLEQLAMHNAKATFFCVGHNVVKFPAVYEAVLMSGNMTANHTYNHMNGWKTDNQTYMQNIDKAVEHINSRLFRPPYGLIKPAQARALKNEHPDWKTIMWSVLSADFDKSITPEKCLENVLKNIRPGSIVLFHDSERAWERMSYALPKVLEYCAEQGWKMETIQS